jgi:prepilin-type N-terminal cleavage/methylation domain-containing protein
MERFGSARGFTAIELLVAMAMLAIVSSQLLLVFQTQQKAYTVNERILDAQEDARLVLDLLVQETRMAGFMMPEVAATSSIDGGASAPDTFCVSDANEIDESTLDGVSDRFDRARLAAAVAINDTFVDLVAGHQDIDGDTANDFSAGQAVIIGEAGDSFCAMIATIVGDRMNLDRKIDRAFSTSARVTPAVMYDVDANGLSRNGLLLSAEVEDLQVEFGIDTNGDGVLAVADGELPLKNDLTGENPAQVRQVRLTVTTRTGATDPEFTGGFPAAANRGAGAADNFRRRRFVTSIRPRNLD